MINRDEYALEILKILVNKSNSIGDDDFINGNLVEKTYNMVDHMISRSNDKPVFYSPKTKIPEDKIVIEKEIISTRTMETQILNYLNEKTGKKFVPVEQNLKLIRARLKEDFTVDKLKQMIDFKCLNWLKDEKMNEYLRPSTLFNAEKCAQYCGEIGVEKPKDDFSSWSNPEFK